MNYEITYSYKNKLVISNAYSITTDFFANVLEITDETSIFLIPQNMQQSTNNGLSISYPATISKWWELTTFFNYNYSTYYGEFDETLIDLSAGIFNFRIQNNFNLPGDIKLDVSYAYNSPLIWRGSLTIDQFSSLNIGIKKDFFENRLQLRITANDIFNKSSDYHYHGNYGG